MTETNFLTPNQEPENPFRHPPVAGGTAGGKPRKKSARGGSALGGKTVKRKKAEKSLFKLNESLNIKPAMPKAKHKIEENLPSEKKGEARNIYFKIALSFAALTVILAGVVLYFGFSKVTLVIFPAQEKINDSLNLEIIDNAKNQVVGPGQISGIVRQAPVEQTKTFSASGKEVLGEEVTGKVTIINNYMKNQPLVATTRLLAPSNKLFRLKNTVNVPAGGQVEAEIYADEPTPAMAIGPCKFTIPGLWAGLQDKIYAQSMAPMKYSEKIKYVIMQSDLDNAVSELKKDLLANAKQEVGRIYSDYDQLILRADNNSVDQQVQGKVGEAKEKFTIKMKIMVAAVAFKGDDASKLAEQKLAASLADDKEILKMNQSDIIYDLGDYNLSQGTAAVNVNFAAKVTLKDSSGIIKKNNLTGLSVEQVKAYLNNLPDVAGYEIKFFPAFVRKMPDLVDRIEIVIKK